VPDHHPHSPLSEATVGGRDGTGTPGRDPGDIASRETGEIAARLGPLAGRAAVRDALARVGRPASRHGIPTPALVVDVDALVHNLDAGQRLADAAGVALRPHAKTHKCATVAREQLARGAVGICVAKVGEAEALSAAGIDGLLVTSPVHAGLVDRVGGLRAAGTDLTVVVDHPDVVASLARAIPVGGVDVLVDVDVGLHRTGVPDAAAAARLATLVAAEPSLRFRGVQGYGGHWQHIPDPAARSEAVAAGMAVLAAAVDAIEAAGLPVEIRSGGGTGTSAIDGRLGALTELQLGSYAYMDREYADALDREESPWRQALFVEATVVSANHHGFVTVDAGLKALATDAGDPVVPGASYTWFGDEHGLVTRPADGRLRVGDRVDIVPPHCDPTVDRYDLLHLVRGDVLVDVVPIEARGRSQ
jgi:D-serine deaminase-like pyridoxal phosphate-dependent protein